MSVTVSAQEAPQVVTVATQGPQGKQGETGPAGPANTLAKGTATTGAPGSDMDFTITGTAPNQTLNLTIPRGDVGPTGPSVTVTGSATTGLPGTDVVFDVTQVGDAVNIAATIPRGDKGDAGAGTGTVGNLCSENVATGTDALGTTVGFTGSLLTLSSSADQAWQGTKSLLGVATGAAAYVTWGGTSGLAGPTFPVRGGQVYTATVHTMSPDSVAGFWIRIYWFKANGTTPAATPWHQGATEAMTPGWSMRQFSAVAPADAVYALVICNSSTATIGHRFYFDGFGFWAGASGKWSPPGSPIVGIGFRDNPTESLVEVYSAGADRWLQVAERQYVGNLLTVNQATCGGATGDLTGVLPSGATAAVQTTGALQGDKCVVVTATAGNAGIQFQNTTKGLITPGQVYTGSAWVRSDTLTRSVYLMLYWYKSDGSTASVSSYSGSSTPLTASWSERMVTAVAPADASYAALRVIAIGSVAGESYLIDKAGLWQGAGGAWAMPGTPVLSSGRRENAAEKAIEVYRPSTNSWLPMAERNQIGNLLPANLASFETDLTGVAVVGSTVSLDANAAMVGSYGVKCVTTAATHWGLYVGGSGTAGIPVTAGQVYTAYGTFKAPLVTNAVIFYAYWFKADGSASSTSYNTASLTALSTTAKSVSLTAVAPADAAYARLRVAAQSAAAIGDEFHVDKMGLWAGAGGEWAMPGSPILGLGRKVTHPNIDDVLTQAWDSEKNRWQTIDYRSGVLDVSTQLANGWTGTLYMSRSGNRVEAYGILDATNATADAVSSALGLLGLGNSHTSAGNPKPGFVAVKSANYEAVWTALGINATPNIRRSMIGATKTDIDVYAQWTTTAGVPTSLPGVVVTPAGA